MANTVSPDVFDGADVFDSVDDVSVGIFVFVGVFVGVFVTKPFNIFFPFVFLVLSCVSFLSVQSTVKITVC